jgi:hypothetical protein
MGLDSKLMQNMPNRIAEARRNLASTPPPITPNTTNAIGVADYVKDKNKGGVANISMELRKIDPSVVGEGFGNVDFSAIKNRGLEQTSMERGLGQTGAKMIELGEEDVPAAIKLNNVLDYAYRQADKAGIKTQDQFAAAFPELIKGANKNDINFLNKYQMGKGIHGTLDMKKLPFVAGAHYERSLKEMNAQQAAPRQATPQVRLSVRNQ